MCMKNINTDILVFEDANFSKPNSEKINIYETTRDIPSIEVEEISEDMLLIPRISLMLSINATQKDSTSKDSIPKDNTIDFDKTYRICIRITETSSGQCVDTVQFNIHPSEEHLSLCRKMYNKKALYRFENLSIAKPPQGKDLCVIKVLIQEVDNGNISDDNWIAQSMHPVRMIIK